LQDLVTTNIAIDAIIDLCEVDDLVPECKAIQLVYRHTPINSPLRRLMRDCWVYEVSPGYFNNVNAFVAEPLKGLPDEFIQDLLLEFYSAKGIGQGQTVAEAFSGIPRANTDKDKCHYHQHDDKYPRRTPRPRGK
jgi:hypothetical protein